MVDHTSGGPDGSERPDRVTDCVVGLVLLVAGAVGVYWALGHTATQIVLAGLN